MRIGDSTKSYNLIGANNGELKRALVFGAKTAPDDCPRDLVVSHFQSITNRRVALFDTARKTMDTMGRRHTRAHTHTHTHTHTTRSFKSKIETVRAKKEQGTGRKRERACVRERKNGIE